MTNTKITRITKRESKDKSFYYTIYFDWFEEERFTYLNSKALQYWKNKGLKTLKVGLEISVIMKNEKHFQIIGFEDLKK